MDGKLITKTRTCHQLFTSPHLLLRIQNQAVQEGQDHQIAWPLMSWRRGGDRNFMYVNPPYLDRGKHLQKVTLHWRHARQKWLQHRALLLLPQLQGQPKHWCGLWILSGKKVFSWKQQAKGFLSFEGFFNSYLLPSLRDARSSLLYKQASCWLVGTFKWASGSITLPSPTIAVACWQPWNILMVSICICTASISLMCITIMTPLSCSYALWLTFTKIQIPVYFTSNAGVWVSPLRE